MRTVTHFVAFGADGLMAGPGGSRDGFVEHAGVTLRNHAVDHGTRERR
jgi:hypothetical protein